MLLKNNNDYNKYYREIKTNAKEGIKTIGLYIFLAILLFFVFLFSLRAVITIAYSDDLALTVRVLFIKIKILPKKDKRKKIHSMSRKKAEKIKKKLEAKAEKKRLAKQKKKEKKQAEKELKEKEKENKEKKSISDIIDIIDLVLALVKAVLKCFFGHLRVDVARFRIKVATGDPATTAVAYGAVSQAVSYLLALLKSSKNVRGLKSADLDIECDFLSESPTADIELSFSMRVWHVFHIAFAALGSFIKKKVQSMAKKKNSGARQKPATKTVDK